MTSYPESFLSGPVDARRLWTVQPKRACLTDNNTATDSRVVARIPAIGALIEASQERIDELLKQQLAVPAYGLEPGPVSFVPTGRVFIRLATDLDVSDFETVFSNLGFAIAERHSHFAFAAWLESSSGDIAEALTQCASVFTVDGIESCEPEMLSPSR